MSEITGFSKRPTQQNTPDISRAPWPTSVIFYVFPENCSMQKKGKISDHERTAKSCEATPTSKIDFGNLHSFVKKKTKKRRRGQKKSDLCRLSSVYKVQVAHFTADLSTDVYSMRILEVIKEGVCVCSLLDGSKASGSGRRSQSPPLRRAELWKRSCDTCLNSAPGLSFQETPTLVLWENSARSSVIRTAGNL